MFSKVKWRRWKSYSGPVIKGKIPFNLSENADHWDRVVWLTARVETGGKFGATTCYDGTGNTSGLIQAIAVYPRELAHEDNNPADDQGPLWKMVEAVRQDAPELLERLDDEFKEIGWKLVDGVICYADSENEIVPGKEIRNELTPTEGTVPRSGPSWQEAKGWALLFHNIFSHPDSFKAQVKFGLDHAHKNARKKPVILHRKTIESLVYRGDVNDTKLFSLKDPLDLAMAVLFSNAVNAPAMAFRKLSQALRLFGRRPNWQNPEDRRRFAKRLIRVLANANYARWNFKIATGRYQRTRKAAMKVWPKEMFTGSKAIMPKTL